MFRTAMLGLCALMLASPALAMGTQGNPEAAPREAVGEYDQLTALNSEVVMALQPSRSTEAERKAAAAINTRLQRAVSAAYKATTAKPFNRAEFDRQAALVRKEHAAACAVLSGC
ncbi:hypothetical protein [Novosphingobium sp. M1R2S20]|uniref:Secreted protein n=1 Tax=Novosphingobium rhizovicinum TaxID=3228928 RepID=A0ABV3RCV6_9SPHN